MNKNLHRIVFNARRGQRMVVAETATSQGKSASGETRGTGASGVSGSAGVATLVFSAALTASLFMGGTVLAQIKADPRAPATQQPTVLTTSNGVPQVNIQTPSAAGVSRNVYGQFDVNGNGAILNNSRTGTATAVGGYVQANPWLAQGSARIILNEVNSTTASQLQGPVEVAGQRAEVIIANPAGIAVSGGSFINASAVTLTTGSVVVNGGSLDSYRVQGGVVSVAGKGLDTGGADYTNILARAVQVNAGIWSSDLRVVTGTNTLSASDPVASAKRIAAASATQPAAAASASSSDTVNKVATNSDGPAGFALDVSALGGMYAGKIFMVGTEAGMGVRNGGALGATSGDIVLSNNGWLSSSGSFYASGNTSLSTQGSQTHSGTTAAQGNLTLAATGSGGSVTSTGQSLVAGGLKADGTLTGSAQTTVTATNGVTMAGKVITPGALQLTGPTVNLSGAQVQADSATITSSTPGANLHADNSKIFVTQTLNLSTGQTLHTAGATVVAKKLNIGAHSIVNTGGSLGQSGEDDLQITLAGSLDNGSGHIAGGGNVQISSSSLTNADKGSVYAAGKLDVTTGQLSNSGSLYAGGDLNLQVNNGLSNAGPSGLIASGGNTTITAGGLGNAPGANIIAGMQSDGKLISGAAAPNLSITTNYGLHNQGNLSAGGEISLKGNGGDVYLGGSTNAGGNIGIRGESIGISGSLVTAKDLEVQAKADFRIEGSGQIGGNAHVTAGGAFSLDGQFTVNKDLNLTAGGVTTTPGSFLMVGHNANLTGGAGVSLGGATTVGNLLSLSGKTVALTGPVDAASTAVSGGTITLGEAGGMTHWRGNLSLAMSGDVNALGGLSVANGASISSGGAVHIGGNAQSGGGLSISASGNLQVDGTVTAGEGTALTAGGTLETLGVQGTSVSLDGQQVTVTGSVVGTTGATHLRGTNGIAVTGDVSSGGGSGVVATTSGALDIGGATSSGAGMTLQAGTTIHLGQQTQATGAMHLQAGGNITADQGLAAGAVAIQAQNLTVAQNVLSGGALQAQTHAFTVTGNVLSGGDTQIVAAPQAGGAGASTVTIGGALATTGALNVHSSGTLQVASSTQADGSLQLKAQGITLGGKTTSGGNSSIDAQGAALNVAGMVGSAGNQSLAGSTITVQGAQALGQMDLQASTGTIDSTSSLLSTHGLTANAAGAITVQGHIASDGATTLQSAGQVNASGTIASGAGGLKVDAGGDIAAATLQSLGNSQLNSTANVTLGNALNIGSYTVTAGGNISQAYVQSGAGLSETAGGGITHTGATLVQGNAVLASGGAQTLGNSPTSGLTATGTITATATTGTISVGADLLANGNITTTATQGAIAVGGNLATQGTVGATAQNGITVGGALAGQSATLGSSAGGVQIASNVQVQTNLNVSAQTNVQAGGTTVAGGTLQASSTSGSVAFGSDLSVGSDTHITAGNGITLGGNSQLVGAAQLQSTAGTISNNGVLATNQTLTVSGNADLLNQGSLQSVGNMSLAAHNITSSAGAPSTITTGGALTANATGALNLNNTVNVTAKTTIALGATGGGSNAGTIQAGNAITLSGGSLANSGQIASQTVSSTGGISNTGTVYGSDTVAVAGSTTNTGQIVATNSVNLGATGNSGVIQAQTVSLGATSNGGSIAGNTVSASSMSNSGSVGATNNISVSGDVNNTGAVAASNITFNGGTLVNSGQVHASGNITINASSINNTAEVVAPLPGQTENTNIPYASSGAIKADGILAISGGSLNNTGTLSSGGVFNIAMGGGISNNKRGFILSGGDITMTAAGVTNDGIVYGLGGAPSTITVASTGGVANGSTGVLLAGNQLTITATSFTNAGDNVNSGVGSLGNANLSTVGGWDAGANPLKANGLLTVNTNGITVDVGKTWEAANVKWNGTLTNYGTVNLGIGNGTVHNESTGGVIRVDTPNTGALTGSYEYTATPPAGYTDVTFVGYTDVLNRARFAAGSFTGGITNIAGDVSAGAGSVAGYNPLKIDQTTIWSGVPVGAPPGTAAEQIFVDSKSIARADFPGTSIIALVGPSAGTIVGGTVTISAGDLTVDKSNTGSAQGGISSAQSLTVGSISGSPAGLAALQNPALLAAAAQQAAALQANAIASGTVTTTVGASSNLGSAGTFTTNPNAPSGAPSGEGGGNLGLPAPDLSTVQGAFAALNAQKVNAIVTDWQALGAQANAINVTNLTLNVSGTLTNAGTINATSGLKIDAKGGIDNTGGMLSAGEWVQLDSQGVGLINSGGTIQSGGGIKATVTGNVSNNGGTITAVDSVTIAATGDITATNGRFASTNYDVVLDADGKLTLTDTKVSAKNGVAHLYGTQGVTIAATQQTKTTTISTNVVQGIQHDAVAGGVDGDSKAAYFEATSSSGSTQTLTTTTWADSSIDAKQIDIQSSKGGVTVDASDLKASNGIRVSAAQDVKILAQRGVANSTTTLSNGTLQQVGGSWDGGGTMELVTTTTDGGSSNQETLRVSTLNAGAGTLSIESTGGNITGQSAQLAGNKILLVTTKAQDGTKLDANGNTIAATAGGGSINLESLQVNGKTVGLADASTGTSALTTQTLTTVQGTLTATGDDKTGGITISANKDVALTAMDIDAGKGNIHVQAGGNVKLGANADAEQRNQSRSTQSSSFFTSTTTNSTYQANEVNAAVTSLSGNNITINAGDSITNYAAQIDGTGTVLQKAGNSALTYTATEVRKYSEENKSTTSLLGLVDIGHANSTTSVLSTEELGSQVFGKQVGIQAKDVVIVGANVAAKDQLEIKADNNVTITAATNTYSATHAESKSGWDLSVGLGSGVSLNKSSSSQNIAESGTTSSASVLGGSTVLITSGKDTTIQASTVVADKGISVNAGGNINILAAANTSTSSSQAQSSSTSIGLMGGLSARQTLFSSNNMSSNSEGTSTTHTTSLLSANGGNLNLTANNGTVTVQGADLLAQGKVIVKAQDVDLQAITDTATTSSQTQTSSFTVGAALAGTVGSKITAISDNLQVAQNTTNDRLQAAATLRAGFDAYKLVNGGAADATTAAGKFTESLGDNASKADPNSGSAFGISFSVGSSSSQQSSSATTSTSRGTTIQAQDIEITATKGDITATGAKLQAENISLDAAQDINLLAAVNTGTIQSSSESHNVGAGVTIGFGQQSGISFQLSAGQSNGNANGSETSFDNTLVTATKNLTVKSGGDTNLVGAQLAGNTVKMDVGGDLNVVTLQDKSDFTSEQHSSGFSISVCVPPICYGGVPVTGNISKNDASINHNYQSAKGQSGIAAGAGGYDITVNGNTNLVGGAITSTAPQDQNTLKTGSLTSSDVNNSQTTSSESSSISLGYSGASGVSTLLTNVRNNALANLAGGAGMPANGSQSGTTQSVISPGNVTVTGTGNAATDANSNTQLATLTSRDASKANGALTNTLTLQQAQQIPAEQQRAAENAQISQLIAPVVFNAVGDIAQQNGWAESSPQKIALHAVAGYIVASASGGNGGQGAVAAAANEATTSSISSIVDKAMPIPAGATPAQARQIEADRNVVKETASTLVGIGAVATTGGSNQQMATGGNIALAADQFNRQLHPTEAKLIKDNAAQYAARRGISVERAEAELTQQAERNNDSAHAARLGAGDAQAQAFLQTLGAGKTMVDGLTGQTYQLFSSDQATRNNHAQFGQYAKTSPDVQQLLDLAYTNVYKPKGGQTIAGLNGSNAGALTGSDLALNDAARDYGNMRKQPAVVQWAVLGELRQERQNNLQNQLGLTEELQQLNSRGDTSPAAATRRGEIVNQLTRLETENSTLRQASVEQIRAMGSVGLLKPIDQREWGEGAGEAIASSGLSLKGLSTASISGRLGTLREAAKESQAATAAAKAEAVAISRARVENNTGADGSLDPYAPVPNAKAQNEIRNKTVFDAANGTHNPHYDGKHGPGTTLAQQYDRAINGTNPQTGGAGRPADASKFFNATDMQTAIKQAEVAYAANPANFPDGNVPVSFNRPIGEGYTGNTTQNVTNNVPVGEYRWSNTATVGIDRTTGKAYTAYPNVGQGVAKPNPLANGVQR